MAGQYDLMFRRHPLLSLATVGYLAVVGWITLGPQPINTGNGYWLWRTLRFFSSHESTRWLTYYRVEFLANVGMFVPIGIFFVLLFGRRLWFMSVISGVLLTLVIEFAQRFIPGRVSDLRDLVANSLGTVVGVLVALVLTQAKARRLRTQRA
jgi:glycopeptide antibiotics resistance protein